MALPKLLKQLFQNNGSINKLNKQIVPTDITVDGATNDGSGNEIATSYIPTTGGTLSGKIIDIKREDGIGRIVLRGGTDSYSGACFSLHANDYVWNPGCFTLVSTDGTNQYELVGDKTGSLTWKGNNVAIFDNVVQGDQGYIKFTNGVIIQWGSVAVPKSQSSQSTTAAFQATWTYPYPFTGKASNIKITHAFTGDTGDSWSLKMYATTKSLTNCICHFATKDALLRYDGQMDIMAIGQWK